MCCFIKPKHLLYLENIKKLYENNKFKMSAPTWNGEFELPGGSYSVSDIHGYMEYVLKNMEKIPSIMIYVNKIENRITFKSKRRYYLEFLTAEIMKLLGSTKNKITQVSEKVPHLEITEVVLVHCNIVNNNYRQDSRGLYTYVPNKSFGQLLDISPQNFIFLKTCDSEFLYIKV